MPNQVGYQNLLNYLISYGVDPKVATNTVMKLGFQYPPPRELNRPNSGIQGPQPTTHREPELGFGEVPPQTSEAALREMVARKREARMQPQMTPMQSSQGAYRRDSRYDQEYLDYLRMMMQPSSTLDQYHSSSPQRGSDDGSQ